MASKVRLVAALDFGTHGTGFAWAFASERERDPADRRIVVFEEWAGQPTTYVKNLSALTLDGSGAVVDWGYEADRTFRTESKNRADLEYYQRFKMGLVDSAHRNAAPGRAPRDLITLYLRSFYEVAAEKIINSSGVTEDEIAWYLTVPAIWRDHERRVMRECAEAAGFPKDHGRLGIAVEPEVAALYCRYDSGHDSAGRPGNRFMVVDAGGGTVDITAYEVAADGLTEIGYTSGGSHGATYMDQYLMETVLAERLGKAVVDRVRSLEPGSLMAIQDEWERAKRVFDPEKRRPIRLPFSFRFSRMLDDEARQRLARKQEGVDDEIVLPPAEVARIFDFVVEPTLALVDDQLRRIGQPAVESILLVGGFGQSWYLQSRMKKHVGGRAAVVVPRNPSMAVLAGAVHYGLQPEKILGRRSRLTYGIRTAMVFEAGRDPETYRIVDSDGQVRCENRFDIIIRADDIVAQDHEERRIYFPLYADQTQLTIWLYTAQQRDPRYSTDSSCEQLGELVLDVSGTVGRKTTEREVEVFLIFGGTEIQARAVDLQTGKEVATTVLFERKV